MKILFIGSRLYDDIDYYVKRKGIESILTESNEDAINLDLPDQVFIVPRGMEGPTSIAISQNVDAIVPLIGIDPPLIQVAQMKEEVEKEYGIPVPDYTDDNVSAKVVKIIQSYVGIVNRMVWRKM